MKPGDIGFYLNPQSQGGNVNHVGIYLGNDYWVHCTGSKGQVIVDQNKNFKLFRKINIVNN